MARIPPKDYTESVTDSKENKGKVRVASLAGGLSFAYHKTIEPEMKVLKVKRKAFTNVPIFPG